MVMMARISLLVVPFCIITLQFIFQYTLKKLKRKKGCLIVYPSFNHLESAYGFVALWRNLCSCQNGTKNKGMKNIRKIFFDF